jgi:superfamily II helicase
MYKAIRLACKHYESHLKILKKEYNHHELYEKIECYTENVCKTDIIKEYMNSQWKGEIPKELCSVTELIHYYIDIQKRLNKALYLPKNTPLDKGVSIAIDKIKCKI